VLDIRRWRRRRSASLDGRRRFWRPAGLDRRGRHIGRREWMLTFRGRRWRRRRRVFLHWGWRWAPGRRRCIPVLILVLV